MSEQTPTVLSRPALEEVREAVKTWLNTYTDLPVSEVTFEALPANDAGICFESAQSPVFLRRYITGGYKAQYQFRLVYRVLPSDDSDALEAAADLTAFASWCETATPPALTDAINVHVERTSDVAIVAAFEDGSQDYSTNLTLTWEVIKYHG